METKKRMEAEMREAGEIIKARKEEKLAKLTSVSRYGFHSFLSVFSCAFSTLSLRLKLIKKTMIWKLH